MIKKIIFFIFILILIFLLIFFNSKNFLNGVKVIIIKLLENLNSFFRKIFLAISDSFKLIFQIRSIREENIKLKKENLFLASKLVKEEKLIKNYEFLEKYFNLKKQKKLKLLFAEVINSFSQDGGEFLIINKGKKDGINIDMPVIVGDALIGKIFEVFSNYSKVLLINSENIKVAAKTNSGLLGITLGKRGRLYVDLISKDKFIKKGEIVLSSGQDGIFPPDFILGKVKTIYNNDAQLFQRVELTSFLDYSRLSGVFVFTNYLK